MSKFKTVFFLCVFCAAGAIGSRAQTFTTLVNLTFPNGCHPYDALVEGSDGSLYGTAYAGGSSSSGTIFKITPGGALSKLFDFGGGAGPQASLLRATDGNFYGTTTLAGVANLGLVFRISRAGKLTVVDSFNGTNGSDPYAALIQEDGAFYGTTFGGGDSGAGTVFKISPSLKLTGLHSFSGSDGAAPVAGLVEGADGDFYGTTTAGGTSGLGTVFKITRRGKLTTLHSFTGGDGAGPYGGLVRNDDGNLYGTTVNGGLGSNCIGGCGTVFKITTSGTLTTLYSFSGSTDSSGPYAGLIHATDGNFYGTTLGFTDNGSIFQMTPAGALTPLHKFAGPDGAFPRAKLVQATDGNFYGTATQGGTGADACGTVFSLSVGLGPFVETLPTSGKVGRAVIILGDNLTGATSVTFNGTAAQFTVASATEIKTTVPEAATTGKVKVVTPHGTLASNVAFRVTP
jgi:uncharacterized repeat protein (TIGR03803 family)